MTEICEEQEERTVLNHYVASTILQYLQGIVTKERCTL